MTRPIAEALRAHGVVVGARGECAGGGVKATITPAGEPRRYSLHIEDAAGRTSDRVVSEPQMAVSLIESWAIDEDADLLTMAEAPATSIQGGAPVSPSAAAVPPASVLLGIGGQMAISNDGAVWAGATMGGCWRLGRACIGLLSRALWDRGTAGPTSDGSASRATFDAFVSGSLPMTRDPLWVMPSLGAGIGWMRTRALDESETTAIVVNGFGLRAEASLAAGITVIKHVTLVLDVGGTWAPRTSSGQNMDLGATITVPGEPRTYLHTGIGLVVSP